MDNDKVQEIKKDGESVATASQTVKSDDNASFHHHHHRAAKILLLIVGVFVIVGGLMAVGRAFSFRHRTERVASFNQGQQFGRMMPQRRGMNRGGQGFAGIGISGKITKIDGNNLTVNDGSRDISVTIADTTSIIKQGNISSKTDLKVDDQATINGTSNSSGQYTATIIRVK
jgi:hypothetical protein